MSNLCCDSARQREIHPVNHSMNKKLGASRRSQPRLRGLFFSDSEGSALVEMAVMLPLMMLIMTGIFSFSLLLFQQIQLTETVCNAGRYLAVARAAADPCASVYSAIQSAPGLSANPTIAITQNGTQIPTTCPYNTTTSTSYLIQGATANVSVISKSSLAVYGSAFKTFYLGSQISEIVQ
ncbi:MAG TPA: TadE/TadG family type IV pilus assembly protein [Terracidiphilus sp.]|nr:TadE/TadG family type IV pilus assembly protein [Terracidiphilus sp.]